MKARNIEVGNLIGRTKRFEIYLGSKDDATPVILKIAKTYEDGSVLSDEAGKFSALKGFVDLVAETETKKGRETAHYDWLFATLAESFEEPSLDDRRVNVYQMPEGASPDTLIPLPKLVKETKVDPRTSVWVLGRLLKIYAFFELIAIEKGNDYVRYPKFSPGDFLIGPEFHRVVYYNYSGMVDDAIATNFVKQIAEYIKNWVVVTDDEKERKYHELLEDLSENGREKAGEAHADLYELVKELWGIEYYPFTTRG